MQRLWPPEDDRLLSEAVGLVRYHEKGYRQVPGQRERQQGIRPRSGMQGPGPRGGAAQADGHAPGAAIAQALEGSLVAVMISTSRIPDSIRV